MSVVSRVDVENVLKGYIDPYLEQDLVTTGSVRNIQIGDGRINVDIELGFPAKGYHDTLIAALHQQLGGLSADNKVEIRVDSRIIAHEVQKGLKPLAGIKNVIAVASGKGGVGKSTTAVNLALALSAEGGNVGLLDADIYGPSQPRMLGTNEQPETPDGKLLNPVMRYGLQTMSIGYLIEEEAPMIWRGPMVTQALEQLLNDTRWSDLDYLIIDLPPGTGDTQLTLSQKVPVSGAVIVTTPQDIALLDARRGLKMFEKVEVPVLGIIENMSTHICSRCGYEEHIFGQGGGERMAGQNNVPLLGSLPLDRRIREETDGGQPTVTAEPESKIAGMYREIARRAAARLSLQAKNYSHKFPNIVIQNT